MNENMKCCICSEAATVIDTEYNEGYCDEHADSYDVRDGPHIEVDSYNDD